MSSAFNEVSCCQYLFGKSEEEVFNNTKLSKPFINQSLDTLMRIHHYLLRKDDAFFLLTPAAFNHQCHLYSLRLAQIKKNYAHKKQEDLEKKNEENRFLHLTFFLSFTFLLDANLYAEVVEKKLSESGIASPQPKKAFLKFSKDPYGDRVRAARLSYNRIFEDYLKVSLEVEMGLSALKHELFLLATTEELTETYYTFPKLAGVIYLVDKLFHEAFCYAIKVKVITGEGTGSFTLIKGTPKKEDPVLVFETLATGGSLSVKECRKLAESCPTYHRRGPQKIRHSESTVCLFCNPQGIDLSPYKKRAQEVLNTPKEMFYALGADYVKEEQGDFEKFFRDEEKYPELSAIYRKALPDIEKFGLSLKSPLTFSVAFVYTDSSEHAQSEKMLMSSPSTQQLKERRIL